MESLEEYLPLWTTEKDRYRLVRLQFPDRRWLYDIYRWDGTYCTPLDQDLCRTVAERMLAAGVSVWDPDDWVLELKMQPYQDLWSGDSAEYLVIRFVGSEQSPRDVIYDQHGEWYPYRIWEGAVRSAVIRKMLASGVKLIETEYDDDAGNCEACQSGNEQVSAEYRGGPEDPFCPFKLLARPSFHAWFSWQFFICYGSEPELKYVARYVTWVRKSALPFRERVRLPPTEQGWELKLIRKEMPVDSGFAEELLARLARIQVPAYVDMFFGGRDGTSFRLTVGGLSSRSDWDWWGDGPEEWQPITQFARDAHEQLSTLFDLA